MKKQCCQNCAYAVALPVGEQVIWVCANTPEKAGQLTTVETTDGCRRHREKRGPIVRLTPPESADPNVRYVPLTQGKFAIVDAADYERVHQYTWCASRSGTQFYAYRNGGATIRLHRFLTNCPKGMVVDHIDGNGLNNRQSNLRICTQRQNSYNSRPTGGSSRYKGVWRDKSSKKWLVDVRHEGRKVHVGPFEDEVEAARAYDRLAHKLFGEYAYLNFPEEIRGEEQGRGKKEKVAGEEATTGDGAHSTSLAREGLAG